MYKYIQILFLLLISTAIGACQQSKGPNRQPVAEEEPVVSTDEEPATDRVKRHILIFGDSITAGYGLEIEQAFPALLQERIDENEWPFRVTNAGLSGETSSGGLNRIDWLLKEPVDIFLLELGGNDGLRGISLDLTKRNLQAIIDRVRAINPEAQIIVAGMEIPPNLGQDYTRKFREIFPAIADANGAILIPFLLDGVGGIPRLNLPDGIHPTSEGHQIIANTVWDFLQPLLKQHLEEMNCENDPEILQTTDVGCSFDPALM